MSLFTARLFLVSQYGNLEAAKKAAEAAITGRQYVTEYGNPVLGYELKDAEEERETKLFSALGFFTPDDPF